MTNFEKLRGTPEQIAGMFCECIENCEECPRSIFERCDEGKNGFVEWLNEEAIEPKDTPKDAPKDVPKGWIKLNTSYSAMYIDTSKIVGLGQSTLDANITGVYTIGREDSPWLVCDSIDEIMKKIKKASQEK